MLTPTDIPDFDIRIRQLRLITAALIAGVFFFGMVVGVSGAFQKPPAGQVVSLLGAAGAVVSVVMNFIVPPIMARKLLDRSSNPTTLDPLFDAYQLKQTVAMALLEGAAFFNLIACMVEHNLWSVGVVVTLVLIMLANWPTRTRILQWIEAQQMSRDFR